MGNKMCTCGSEETGQGDKANVNLLYFSGDPLYSRNDLSKFPNSNLPVIMQSGEEHAGDPYSRNNEPDSGRRKNNLNSRSQGKEAQNTENIVHERGENPNISQKQNSMQFISPSSQQPLNSINPKTPVYRNANKTSQLIKSATSQKRGYPSEVDKMQTVNLVSPATVQVTPYISHRRNVGSVSPRTARKNRYSNYVSQALKVNKLIPGSFSGDVNKSSSKERLVIEGGLLKYKPGVNENYLERWCVLTKSFFSYFADKPIVSTKRTIQKPIIKVPLSYIDSVQKVLVEIDAEIPRMSSSSSKPTKPLFQFEIFLKPNIDASQIFKSSIVSLDPLKKRANSLTRPLYKSLNLGGCGISRTGNLNESKTTTSKTPYEFKSQFLGQDPNVSEIPHHKNMPEIMDQILEDAPLIQQVKKTKAKNWIPDKRSEELLLVLDGAHFENVAEKEDYRNYKKSHLEELKQIVIKQEDQLILVSPSKWTQRELEWGKAERRLLFASSNEETCNNWVSVLNWMLSKNYSH